MIFKTFAVVMIVLFSFAIVVQFNDPDTTFWIILYGISVLTTVLALTNVALSGFYWLVLGIYLASVAWLSPNIVHTSLEAFAAVGMDNMEQELVREFWGMVICTIWAVVLVIRDSRLHPIFTKEEQIIQTEEPVCN